MDKDVERQLGTVINKRSREMGIQGDHLFLL